MFIFSTGGFHQSSCYSLDYSLNEWTLLGNLNTARSRHASALLNNGDLWMTGGNSQGSGIREVKLKLPRLLFQINIFGSRLNIFNYKTQVQSIIFAQQIIILFQLPFKLFS
jgi:hypothetical protein